MSRYEYEKECCGNCANYSAKKKLIVETKYNYCSENMHCYSVMCRCYKYKPAKPDEVRLRQLDWLDLMNCVRKEKPEE